MLKLAERSLSLLLTALIFSCVQAARAQVATRSVPVPTSTEGARLQFVVILTRHGVRSPTRPLQELETYAAEAWPSWGVKPGELTAHGAKLIHQLGSYDRAYLAAAGLLQPSGCADAPHIRIRADVDQRTRETGRAWAEGALPGCHITVDTMASGADPIFHALATGVAKPDRELALASVTGRIGGNTAALVASHRHAFEILRYLLTGCAAIGPCAAEEKPGKQAVLKLKSEIDPGRGDRLADVLGPLKAGSELAEDFLLEYTDGMPEKNLGWGRLNRENLLEVMSIHTLYEDVIRRDPYLARAQISNLLSHILRSMEQAVSRKEVPGALGKAGDRVLLVVGHDGNIANVGAMLGVSWLLDGYQRNDTTPGGALIFELWKQTNGEFTIHAYYRAQSLDQMYKAVPLSLDEPPLRSRLFLHGYSRADADFSCSWNGFQRALETAIDPAFVKP